MTSERWELVTKIFAAALDQPQSARNDFVSRQCNGDSELESEVLKLLAADEHAGSFLEQPALATLSRRAVLDLYPSLPTIQVGAIVSGRFEILRLIGQGGMGQVYEALDLELKARVALKVVRPDISSDPRMLSRFRREVQFTRRITHPNVCRTFDIERHSSTKGDGTSGDLTFLTMELLEGETLADLLRRKGRLTVAEAYPLVLQIIEALGAAHAAGIVHRDFKPSNVLLVKSNLVWKASAASTSKPPSLAGLRVVVTDFGLARAALHDGQISAENAATSLTGNQTLMGTLIYMAPEQFERGEATVASDIYSLGLVMYEMVTGKRPFADPIPFAEAARRLKKLAPSAATLVPDLNRAWDAAISRCLALDPNDRFANVQQVSAALQNPAANALPRPTTGAVTEPKPAQPKPRRKILAAAAIIAVVASLSALAFRHYWMKAEEARLAEGSTVLLTDIQNGTGDTRFDSTTELVRRQLLQSPYFSLMDSDKIHKTLGEMLKPDNTPLDPETAREVAMRNGVRRVVFGTVSRVGDSYVLDLDIEQPDNNPLRFRQHWQNHWTWSMSGSTSAANSAKDMPGGFLDAIRDSSDWIRSQVGESANDIARIDAPPQDVTTDNWEALSDFAEAERFKADGQTDKAIVALQGATAADPHFALGYMRLGDLLNSVSRFDEGYRAYRNALAQEEQQRLTRREKLRLEGIYANDAKDFGAAESAFREYTVFYPNDYLGWFYRATPLMKLGRVEEAIDSLKKAYEIDPEKMFAPAHIARFDLILGNFDDAARWIQRIRNLGYPDDAELISGESTFLQGKYQESFEHFSKLEDSHDALYRSYAYSLLARLFAEQRQYQGAMESLKQGIAGDLQTGDKVHQADKILDRGYIEFKSGQYDACLRDTDLSLALDRSLQRFLNAATLLGQAAAEAPAGKKGKFAGRLKKLETQLSPNEFKPFSEIVRAHLRGEVFLASGNWDLALEEFKKADNLESPSEDKEYLARVYLEVASHISDQAEAAMLRQRARDAYSVLGSKPGLVWEWAQDYFPGFTSGSYRRVLN
jgi:serine/threonine protein kinase/Tfp pilus assembly protein PilF